MQKLIIPICISLFLWSCTNKSSNLTQNTEQSYKIDEIEIVEEARVNESETPIKVAHTLEKKPIIAKLFKEKKVLKRITSTVPSSCLSWSDGCNTCDKVKKNRASCTVYTCNQKTLFSCLVWQ